MLNTIGVDVSKGTLDAFSLADREQRQFTNDGRGIAQLVNGCDMTDQPLVDFQATGAYHREFEEILGERGIPCNKVNPRHARRIAEASGKLAKTDRVDTTMLAYKGVALSLGLREPKPKKLCELAELPGMRDALVKDQTSAKQREKTATLRETRGLIANQLRLLARQIEKIDRLIIERVKADPELSGRFEILLSILGIGKITASTLLIEMPELGELTGKLAASLAVLAPVPKQTGNGGAKSTSPADGTG